MPMFVTKIGGSIARRADPVLDEVDPSDEVVLVHGFGPQTTRLCRQEGREARWIRSPQGVRSRFTDEATLAIMQTAAREVGQSLCRKLEERGTPARRIAGHEGLLDGEAKPALRHEREDGRIVLVRGNRSGRVQAADPARIRRTLEVGRVPVVTPLARDEQGLVSVDADRAAAAIAGELDADELLVLTDVDRVLDEHGEPIETLDLDRLEQLVETGAAEGGMLRKLVAAREAIEAGVQRALIANGTRPDPIQRALEGDGTEVIQP